MSRAQDAPSSRCYGLPPNNIVLVPVGSAVDIRGEKSLLAGGINVPTEGRMAAHKVDSIFNAKVNKRLGKVVHGFVCFTDGNEDLPGTTAEGLAHGLVLLLILDKDAIIHQRILAEEIASLLGRFLKQR